MFKISIRIDTNFTRKIPVGLKILISPINTIVIKVKGRVKKKFKIKFKIPL